MSEYGDVINQTFGLPKQQAKMQAVSSFEDDPEQASKALTLGQDTGVNPSIIYGDVNSFDLKNKARLTAHLIDNNQHLQDYINSHPLAAKLSNDDWGQLDTVSEKLERFKDTTFLGSMKNFAAGAAKELNKGPIGQWILDQPGGAEFATNHPASFVAWQILGSPIEVPMRLLNSFIEGGSTSVGRAATAITGDKDLGSKIEEVTPQLAGMYFTGRMSGNIKPLHATAHNAALKQAATDSTLQNIKELSDKIKPWTDTGEVPPVGIDPKIDQFHIKQSRNDIKWLDEALAESEKSATKGRNPEIFAGFIRQHTEAEIGVSFDAIQKLYGDKLPHAEDNILGWVEGIEDKLRAAEATGGDVSVPLADWLAKVDPGIAKELHDDIRVRPSGLTLNEGKELTEQKQAIKVLAEEEDKVDLYHGTTKQGFDKLSPDFAADKKYEHATFFSDKPGEAADYAEGEGGRVFKTSVNRSDLYKPTQAEMEAFASKGDFVKLALDQSRQMRKRGVHLELGSGTNVFALHDTSQLEFAVESVRSASALKPLFEEGPAEQLKIKKRRSNQFGGHDFEITDEKGSAVGSLNITEQHEGLDLHVDWIGAGTKVLNSKGGVDNVFGPGLIRGLLEQLKEQFPKAEFISGDRVSGAREKAGTAGQVRIPLRRFSEENLVDLSEMLKEGIWEPFGLGAEALIPTEKWTAKEQEIIDKIDKVYAKIIPKGAEFQPARQLQVTTNQKTRNVAGLHMTYKDRLPVILVALDRANPLGTARHEAIHHLRQYGFFTPEEWSVLREAAVDLDWINAEHAGRGSSVKARYKGMSVPAVLEEAVADAFKYWERKAEAEGPVGKIFAKMKDFFDQIKQAIKEALGYEPTVEDLFKKVERGEVGSREGTAPLNKQAFKAEEEPSRWVKGEKESYNWIKKHNPDLTDEQIKQQIIKNYEIRIRQIEYDRRLSKVEGEPYPPDGELLGRRQRLRELKKDSSLVMRAEEEPELPGMTRQEDLDVFKASALNMSVVDYKRNMKLIEKRNAQDAEAQLARATRDEERRQTKEWKENMAKVRDEVAPEIENRPDIAVGAFFRNGILYGEDTHKRPKLSAGDLSKEQREALPDSYVSDKGIHPDDVAGLFGYQSGTEMVERLTQYEKERGELSHNEYVKKVTEAEVEKQMARRYGNLEENILSEVQDHVLGDTQMDILHEQTLYLATQAGMEMPFSKQAVRDAIKQEFGKSVVGSAKAARYLADAGKAGRAERSALLNGDATEAFKQAQRQEFSMLLAKEAKKLEKEKASFERTAKTFSKREVPSVPQEYTNFIHHILMRVGEQVRRSVQDLQQTIASGEHENLETFVASKEADMREVPVAEFLFDPAFRKPVEQLTANEFRAVHDSIKTLVKNGRDEKKIIREGEEADLAEVKGKMIEQLQEFKERKYKASEGTIDKLKHIARTYLASSLQLESLFNRFDRGNPHGVFTQYVMRGLAMAANYESSLERKYSRQLAEIADKANLKELIENPIFVDPLSRSEANPEGVLLQLSRKNLRAILQNLGNESNLDKLARGYQVEPQAILDWANKHATKEDWKWAQAQGDIFAEIKKEADQMYRNLAGIEPESIEIRPVTTPHGTFKGWYSPIIYHPIWEGRSKKLMGGDVLEQDNYVRATTPKGYTKQRTGYAAPLSLDLDAIPSRMKMMIHDIAFRPEVINVSKIFYDHDIRRAMTKHYGKEYEALLIPYLRDVANSGNYRSDAAKVGTQVSEFMRQNIIATLIGFNPGTVMKHGPTAAINSLTEVGPINFLKAVKGLFEVNAQTGETNWRFAMDTSEELSRRHRHFTETFKGAQEDVLGERTWRDTMVRLGSYPVAMSDLLSAVPTWLAKYESAMREGVAHGDAVFEADRAVRRAHGSSVITNRPSMMRGGPMQQWISSLYGFFSHILNRQYELMWKSGDTLGLVKKGEYTEAAKKVPELTWGLFSYILFPALIEELVSPITNDEKESWGKKAAKGLVKGVSSSWVGIRDIATAALSGHDPSAGLLSTTFKSATDLYRDLAKDHPLSKQHAGAIIQHGATAFGALTGLTNAQEGKAARFIYDYTAGNVKPKGYGQWWHGLRYGNLKEFKK